MLNLVADLAYGYHEDDLRDPILASARDTVELVTILAQVVFSGSVQKHLSPKGKLAG